MPILLVRASLNSTNYRTKLGQTNIFDVLPAGTGTTPNGNTALPFPAPWPFADDDFFRNVITVRNVRNLFVPASTDVLYYDYFDNPNMTVNGFPLEPGAAIDIYSPQLIFFASSTGNNIPVAYDQGEF
jgi:hypothetical protein